MLEHLFNVRNKIPLIPRDNIDSKESNICDFQYCRCKYEQ